jgi:pimeloyl-ACP methyl ester carboxylesterase
MTRTGPSTSSSHRLPLPTRLQAMNMFVQDSVQAAAVLQETPVPVPGLDSLYQLPSSLHAVYQPVPTPVKASLWLFAVIMAAMTTKQFKALAVRLVSMSLPHALFPWKRKLLLFVIKTIAIGSLSTILVQDLFWGPSRVTVQQLMHQYWLPSRWSKYQVLNVVTDEQKTSTRLGVHYLQIDSPNAVGADNETTAIYVNHGFGASVLSWLPAMEPLAQRLNASLVVGHDATGFGFTDRPQDAQLFTALGSAKIGLAVWKHATKEIPSNNNSDSDTNGAQERQILSRVILMGHSMGALATLRMAFEMDPLLLKHVILVAPALQQQQRSTLGNIRFRLPLLQSLLDIPFGYLLRRIVGMKGAWRKGLELAWGDPKRLLDSDVLRYQWPSIGKGWEMGLLAFAHAQSSMRDMTDKELVQRVLDLPNTTLSVIVASKDRIVPPISVRTFFKDFPSVEIEQMEGLGHDPFEEDAPAFVNTVARILQKQRMISKVSDDVKAVAET